MTIERIHQEIKFRWNKLNSNHKKDFPQAYLDDAINKATDDYIEIFYSGNNTKEYKLGFEVTQQRTDMLQTLIPRNSDGSVLTFSVSNVSTDEYQTDITLFNPSYRHFLTAYVIPVECPSKRIPVSLIRTNDLETKLADHNTQPSLRWNRCLGLIRDNKIILYTKNYSIVDIHIEYIKNPTKVFSGGYNSLEFINGDTLAYQSISPKVTSELPSQYHDLLVDMTVQYIARVLEDEQKFTLQKEQIISKI